MIEGSSTSEFSYILWEEPIFKEKVEAKSIVKSVLTVLDCPIRSHRIVTTPYKRRNFQIYFKMASRSEYTRWSVIIWLDKKLSKFVYKYVKRWKGFLKHGVRNTGETIRPLQRRALYQQLMMIKVEKIRKKLLVLQFCSELYGFLNGINCKLVYIFGFVPCVTNIQEKRWARRQPF